MHDCVYTLAGREELCVIGDVKLHKLLVRSELGVALTCVVLWAAARPSLFRRRGRAVPLATSAGVAE